jgi:hypothetical protein
VLAATRWWAVGLVAVYVAAVVFVGFKALGYERVLYVMAEEEDALPALAEWTFHAHRYTPLFFIFSIPAILCAVSDQLSAAQRRVAMTASAIGLLWLAVWFGVIWLGMGLFVHKLETVI